MNRRQALRGLAVAGSSTLVGCSAVTGAGGTVLGKIEVLNSSYVANRIRLILTRDDEELLDRTIRLAAIDAESGARGTLIEPSWSEIDGQYTVHAVHYDESGNRESSSREYTFTRADYDAYYGDSHEDPGCIGALVKIGSLSETENGVLAIGPTHMETPCGTPETR